MSSELIDRFRGTLGEYLPSIVSRLNEGDDMYRAIEEGLRALEQGSLSWAQLNQIMHRSHEAGMEEGFPRYYCPRPQELIIGKGVYAVQGE